MAKIELKTFKGIATNADPTDLGNEYALTNQNFLLDTPGSLVKRPGRSNGSTINTLKFSDVKYWSPSNVNLAGAEIAGVWTGYDSDDKKLKTIVSNLFSNPAPTPTVLGSAYSSNIPTDFDLQDHGTEFRYAPNNLAQGPKILQHISRNFFSGNYTVDEFVFQDALLSYPAADDIVFESLLESASAAGLAIDVNKLHSYKLSVLYDGFQEMPLGDSFKSLSTANNNRMAQLKLTIPASSSGTAPNKTYAFNPRITAIKIYREIESAGTFFHIGTIPINTTSNNQNTTITATSTNYKVGRAAVYADALIGSTLASGIFADFDCGATQTSTTDVTVEYFVVKKSEGGNANSVLSNGFPIWQASPSLGSSNITGPGSNSDFVNRLSKGYMNIISGIPGGADDFFNEEFRIARVLVENPDEGGSSQTLNSYTDVLNGSCHTNALIFHNMDNGDRIGVGQWDGGIAVHSNSHKIVQGSVGKAILLTDSTTSYSSSVSVHKNYVETYSSNTATYYFYDVGLTSGAPQPFVDDLKVKVNYKYSQMMGNRLFVGNVRLDPGGDNEDRPDWIIFSEAGMPDILPTINYIQVKDQQGGYITGLNRILDSLVVFMSRGIFRLDVGSTGNPADWSLMEADKNIGCVASKAIISVKDNLFFCARDNIYQITPDFRFNPIAEPIKDVYTGSTNLQNSRMIYDVLRNRIICRFGDEINTQYVYNLDSQSWTTMKFYTNGTNDGPDLFSINDTLDVIGFKSATSGGGGGG
tara:strand:- start:9527 stop:11788 length:2262 start_codon:yes stop_codon:yes gene_type:complete